MSNDRRSARLRHEHTADDITDLTDAVNALISAASINISQLTPAGTTAQFLRGDLTWSDTIEGDLTVNAGGQTLNLKAGAADHAYLAFYARTAAPSTRSAYFGYGGGGTTTLSLVNELASGQIVIGTNGVNALTLQSTTAVVGTGNLRIDGASGGNQSFSGAADSDNLALIFGVTYDGTINPYIRGYGGTHASTPGYLQISAPSATSEGVSFTNPSQGTVVSIGSRGSNGHRFYGTTNTSHIHYSTNEDWYIRAGKSTGSIIIGDTAGAGITLGGGSGNTISVGNAMLSTVDDIRSNIYYGRSDTTKYLQPNAGGLSYGGWIVQGSNTGYYGIAVWDGADYPTIMSNGNAGLYLQGQGKWMWQRASTTAMLTEYELYRYSQGAFPHYGSGSYMSGIITVQSGGSASGGADGDIFLIY